MNDTETLPDDAPFDDEPTVEAPEVDPEQKIVHNPSNAPEESEKV